MKDENTQREEKRGREVKENSGKGFEKNERISKESEFDNKEE